MVRASGREDRTCRNRRADCDHEESVDRVDVVIASDKAAEQNNDKIGYCGMGAGAHLELIKEFDGDPDDGANVRWAEEITSAIGTELNDLPTGNTRELGSWMTEQRTAQCWDGNNHVPAPMTACEELLRWIRECSDKS